MGTLGGPIPFRICMQSSFPPLGMGELVVQELARGLRGTRGAPALVPLGERLRPGGPQVVPDVDTGVC